MLNLVHKTLFTNLSKNKGPSKERPVHSRPNLGASEEGNLSLMMCSKEAYRFDEVYYIARDREFKVIRKTALHAGPPVSRARALQREGLGISNLVAPLMHCERNKLKQHNQLYPPQVDLT